MIQLFANCRLVERVLDAWEENDSDDEGLRRKGYMGHLTRIANLMVSESCPVPSIHVLLGNAFFLSRCSTRRS